MSAGSQGLYGSSTEDNMLMYGGSAMPTNETQNMVLLSSPGGFSQAAGGPYQTPSSHDIGSVKSNSQKRQELPIFQLLKAFKLQQYAQKLAEVGYSQDIYKLALLTENQRLDLIGQLKVLPGHKAKLMSLFDVIDELYPRKVVTEQLKHYTTPGTAGAGSKKGATNKRMQSAYGGFRSLHTSQQQHSRGGGATRCAPNPRSLISLYEALDPQTKQAFNNTFLMNLESVKYQIPQLFQQHFNPHDRNAAINSIFPPQYYYNPQVQDNSYGYAQQQIMQQAIPTSYEHEQEMQQLVTKFVGGRAALHQPSSHSSVNTTTVGPQQTRVGSNSANRQQVQENERHLKQEMAHTMKVIERINREFEQLTKATQEEYDQIRHNQRQRGQNNPYGKQSTGSSGTRQQQMDSSSSLASSKRKNSTTYVSINSYKPQSVQQTKRNANHAQLPAGLKQQPPPSQQKTPSQLANNSEISGRFQSNRQLARQQQMMHPRVITEHEVASEMTTPSKLGNRERSLTKNNSHNVSAVGLMATGLKSTQSGFKVSQGATTNVVNEEITVRPDEENTEESTLEQEQVQQPVNIPIQEPKVNESVQRHMEVEEEILPFEPCMDEEWQKMDSSADVNRIHSAQKQAIVDEPVPQKKERKLSPLLEREERELIWNNVLGHSLDTKQVSSALGYLDLKQICLCLAHAINRHIQFSQGFYFLDDLQEQIKALHLEDHLKLDFSYEIDPKLRIELPTSAGGAQKNKIQNDKTKKEFEDLKNKLKVHQEDGVGEVEESGLSPKKRGGKQPFEYKEQGLKLVLKQQQSLSEEDQFERDASGAIEDEVGEYGLERNENQDEEYIQDYYGNSGAATLEKQKLMQQVIHDLEGLQSPAEEEQIEENQDELLLRQQADEPIDLDYSYSHLEDFLRSHRNTTVVNMGSMVASSHVNSNQKPVGAGAAANATSTTTQQLMNTFLTSYNRNKGTSNNGGQSARASHQPHLVVESIPERKAAEECGGSSGDGQMVLMKLKPVQMTMEGHPSPSVAESNQSQSIASLQIDVRTKEGFKDLIRFQMRIFDCNYDFETDQLIDAPLPEDNPTLEELYYYCKYVIISGRMEKEIPILCLVYIERFLSKTGILINHLNWKRLTLISLCLASKIWDDDSLENVHFPKVMPEITVKEIASLEKVFLQFLDFDLLIRGAEYAKYYFVLKTFAQEQGFNSCLPPVGPLNAQKMSELQNNTAKVESELRDKYEIKLSLQKTM